MGRLAVLLAVLLLCLSGCAEPVAVQDDDDSAGDDDDSMAADDDDSAGDDDDSAAVPEGCSYVLALACADLVVAAPGASGSGFGDPQRAVNGVRGGGTSAGGQDVYSMGLEAGVNDSLVLAWSGRRVVDAPGVDLVIFENPFEAAGPSAVFMDLVIVEVSADGENWWAFPHSYGEASYSSDPADWIGFAGRTPVLLHEEENSVDPLDSSLAGGDGFDLADLAAPELLASGVAYVRLRSAGTEYPSEPISNGPDIDGLYAAELVEDAGR